MWPFPLDNEVRSLSLSFFAFNVFLMSMLWFHTTTSKKFSGDRIAYKVVWNV